MISNTFRLGKNIFRVNSSIKKWDTKFHWNSQNFAQNAKCDIIGLFPFVTTKSNGKAGFARSRIHYVGKNGFSGKNPLSSDWQTFITTLEAA